VGLGECLLSFCPSLFLGSLTPVPLDHRDSSSRKEEDEKCRRMEDEEVRASNIANKQWTAAIHEWKRGWNDGSANWLLLDSNRLLLFGDTPGYDDR